MNVITIKASGLNGGIGSEIERIVRVEYSNNVMDRVFDYADVNGPEGVMFMAGMEACRTMFLLDVTSPKVAAEATMLFYEAAWKESREMEGRGVKEAMSAVIDIVAEACEEKANGDKECDCPKCRAEREAEGQ